MSNFDREQPLDDDCFAVLQSGEITIETGHLIQRSGHATSAPPRIGSMRATCMQ
jgi:hypothetical protein